tara:strand:- start:602 stop:787 length:186 start_codon:yes stop_codon:yes gene_type:complete
MESVIKELPLPTQVESLQEILPAPVVETNNNARDFGILIGVVVVAAICAKLYKCTAKKKND